jgi:predicted RNase H-like HicB family nuclease
MKKKEIYQYTVFIESCEEGGYFADCPSLPGCHVQGETLEETLQEMKAAIDAYLEDLKARHEPIPRPLQVTIASIGVAI